MLVALPVERTGNSCVDVYIAGGLWWRGSGGATAHCNNSQSLFANLPLPEAEYMGYAPESSLSNVMITMPPVGQPVDCAARLVTQNSPAFTFGTMVR